MSQPLEPTNCFYKRYCNYIVCILIKYLDRKVSIVDIIMIGYNSDMLFDTPPELFLRECIDISEVKLIGRTLGNHECYRPALITAWLALLARTMILASQFLFLSFCLSSVMRVYWDCFQDR